MVRNLLVTLAILFSLILDGASFGRGLELMFHVIDHHSKENIEHYHHSDRVSEHHHHEQETDENYEEKESDSQESKREHSHRITVAEKQLCLKQTKNPEITHHTNYLSFYFSSKLYPRDHLSYVFRPPIHLVS